jgi:SprT protein
MHLTAELKARVTAKIKDGIARAEKRYGRTFPMPTIGYDLTGRVAGYANYIKWHIQLNADLLVRNVDDFIARTVPHELAHLITDRVYPENHRNKGITITRTGRVKREKRDIHGTDWQSVCLVLGMTDVTRCHSYDTTETKRVTSRSRTVEWQCPCGAKLMLSPKISAELAINPDSRWHKSCRCRRLFRAGTQPAPTSNTTVHVRPQPAPILLPKPTPTPVLCTAAAVQQGASKIDVCSALYKAAPVGTSRTAMIALFVANANCTPTGAATYYQTLKKKFS